MLAQTHTSERKNIFLNIDDSLHALELLLDHTWGLHSERVFLLANNEDKAMAHKMKPESLKQHVITKETC